MSVKPGARLLYWLTASEFNNYRLLFIRINASIYITFHYMSFMDLLVFDWINWALRGRGGTVFMADPLTCPKLPCLLSTCTETDAASLRWVIHSISWCLVENLLSYSRPLAHKYALVCSYMSCTTVNTKATIFVHLSCVVISKLLRLGSKPFEMN